MPEVVVKARGVSRPTPSYCSLCWEVFSLECKQSGERAGLCGRWVWKLWMWVLSCGEKQESRTLVILLLRCFLSVLSAEACPVFYGAVGTVFLGSKTLLNSTFDLVDATDEEKGAMGKLLDCFNEEGFRAKLFIIELVVIYSLHPLPFPAHSHIVQYATWE